MVKEIGIEKLRKKVETLEVKVQTSEINELVWVNFSKDNHANQTLAQLSVTKQSH